MASLQSAVEKLSDAQQGFLGAADAVPAADWNRPPDAHSWSAAQLVAHLCKVERGVLSYADRVLRKTPLPVTFFKRLHLPIALVESRLIKRKSPVALQPEPELLANKETMLAELRGVRERTLAFLEETHGRDCSVYCWRHPFLGTLNFYDWFTFVGAHQIRHTKQMVETCKNIPKRVANSQK
jgi:DinB superfamily